MKRKSILFLCHRVPYPPNKGDKIRSLNLIKFLSRTYNVYLGSFIENPKEALYQQPLTEWCSQLKLIPLNRTYSIANCALSLCSFRPLTKAYFSYSSMQDWIDNTIKENAIDTVFVFSSAMIQYTEKHKNLNRIVDYVDVDSDKWLQYANTSGFLKKLVYLREYFTLRRYEMSTAISNYVSILVSNHEVLLFRKRVLNDKALKIIPISNGVDSSYFDPMANNVENNQTDLDVVFTGAMDYWANIDAMLWFTKNVWPLIHESLPSATLYIVGLNPDKKILNLDGNEGISVTGEVNDIRPYIKQAKVVIAPLQIARGIQNKVLEAMSMAKPIVCTSKAIEGIETNSDKVWIIDDAIEMANKIISLIETPESAEVSRAWVVDKLQWQKTLLPLNELLVGALHD